MVRVDDAEEILFIEQAELNCTPATKALICVERCALMKSSSA